MGMVTGSIIGVPWDPYGGIPEYPVHFARCPRADGDWNIYCTIRLVFNLPPYLFTTSTTQYYSKTTTTTTNNNNAEIKQASNSARITFSALSHPFCCCCCCLPLPSLPCLLSREYTTHTHTHQHQHQHQSSIIIIIIIMKYSKTVSSSRRKNRKAHFTAHSEARRKLMSAALSKELQARHSSSSGAGGGSTVRSMPVRQDDEVAVVRGIYKTREGKVVAVFRKKMVVHIERLVREKSNGATVYVGIPASNLVITKLKMDKDRKAKLEAKSAGGSRGGKKEGAAADDVAMSNVD